MPKEGTLKALSKPRHVLLPFTTFVKGLLQVDPKRNGKLTTKYAKGKKR